MHIFKAKVFKLLQFLNQIFNLIIVNNCSKEKKAHTMSTKKYSCKLFCFTQLIKGSEKD